MKKILKTISLVVTVLMVFTFIQKDTRAANDFLIDESTKTLTRYTGTAATVVVPDTIENIAANAFINNTSLISVQLPTGLKTIQNSAFEGCTNLKSVEFSGVIENLETIGDRAFYGCNQLTVNWVIRNGHNINVTAGSLQSNNHSFLMLSQTNGETENKINNLNGTYYQAIEEKILMGSNNTWLTVTDQEFVQGYIDMTNICNLYNWYIIGTAGEDPWQQYDDSLYKLFKVPTDNSQIDYRIVNDPGAPLFDPPIYAYVKDNKFYFNGQKSILYCYASYSGSDKEIEIGIFVNESKPESFKIDTPPLKTTYYAGETFDPTGIVVSLKDRYNDTLRISYDIRNEYTYDQLFIFNGKQWGEPLVLSANDTSITVELVRDLYEYGIYEGGSQTYFTTSLPITVKSVYATEISVATPPTKVNYFEGDKFDPIGLVLHVKNNNGSEEDVTYDDSTKDKFTFSLDTLQDSDTQIEITYDGQTVNYDINVSPVEISNVAVKDGPQLEYYEGDVFDPSGLTLTVHYNNGTTQDVAYTDATKKDFQFSLNQLKASDEEVVIDYHGKKTSQRITVHPLLIDTVDIKSQPEQLEYYEDDIFNPLGLVLTVKYNNGRIEDIVYSETTKNNFIFSSKQLTMNDQEIEFIYQSNKIRFPIVVKERYTKNKVEKDNVEIEGQFEEQAYLVIEERPISEEGILKDKQILGNYEVSVIGKYKGELKLTFEIGTEHNGKRVYILHQKQDRSIETFEEEIKEGKVTVTVHELSPFIIYIDKENENTGHEDIIVPPADQTETPNINVDNEGMNQNQELTNIKQPIMNNENNIQTGDNETIILYITIGGIGLAGIGYYLFKRKQKE